MLKLKAIRTMYLMKGGKLPDVQIFNGWHKLLKLGL